MGVKNLSLPWLCLLLTSQFRLPLYQPIDQLASVGLGLSLAAAEESSNPYRCDDSFSTVKGNNWHIRGTNIGGWLVLEPWITPSLFYQFLGAYEKWGEDAPNRVAFDCYSFCTALGKEEANRQLRRHWEAWVREEDIKAIADTGADTIRVPVGDFMFVPYEPYIGCFDGAVEEFNRLLSYAAKYQLKVLIDIHAMKGGQNAFDNSGYSVIRWTSPTTYDHIITAGWLGEYDPYNRTMNVNQSSIEHGLKVIQRIVDMYKDRPEIIGLEALNEPFYDTPIEPLKEFYWKAYHIIHRGNPNWLAVFHDAFRLSPYHWGGFLENCPNFAMDTHLYLAWGDDSPLRQYAATTCARLNDLMALERVDVPMIVGEWSLATDNCAMWLQGLNNNIFGYPKKACEMVPCAEPYMGYDQPGTPLDPSKGVQDPFGSAGMSTPAYGMCPVDVSFDGNDHAVTMLAQAQLQVFEATHGQFFWNFRTELEPRWSYLEAVKRGWLPSLWNKETLASMTQICTLTGGVTLPEEEVNSESSSMILSGATLSLLLASIVVLSVIVAYHVNKSRSQRRDGYLELPQLIARPSTAAPATMSLVHEESVYQRASQSALDSRSLEI
jgi:glucan 1,3-beta-glucosidase